MALVQEPISFAYKDKKDGDPTITLLINPETLTLNFKKVITRTRTKSRIVSFYWGQEPVSFSYAGQTGNMWPGQQLLTDNATRTTQSISDNVDALNATKEQLLLSLEKAQDDYQALAFTVGAEQRALEKQAEIDDLNAQIATVNNNINFSANSLAEISSEAFKNFGEQETLRLAGLELSTHTDVLKKSPKYQMFDKLRQFYEESQNINRLVRVKYRDWILDGYFESFGFTDSALSPWNWKYTLAFTVLNWDKTTSWSGYLSTVQHRETVLVADEPTAESDLVGFQNAGFIT